MVTKISKTEGVSFTPTRILLFPNQFKEFISLKTDLIPIQQEWLEGNDYEKKVGIDVLLNKTVQYAQITIYIEWLVHSVSNRNCWEYSRVGIIISSRLSWRHHRWLICSGNSRGRLSIHTSLIIKMTGRVGNGGDLFIGNQRYRRQCSIFHWLLQSREDEEQNDNRHHQNNASPCCIGLQHIYKQGDDVVHEREFGRFTNLRIRECTILSESILQREESTVSEIDLTLSPPFTKITIALEESVDYLSGVIHRHGCFGVHGSKRIFLVVNNGKHDFYSKFGEEDA